MKAKKYNPKTREFKTTDIPEESCIVCLDMEKIIPCASCGKKVLYVDTFTSNNIRSFGGFGYAICKQCAKEEEELAKEATIHIHKEI